MAKILLISSNVYQYPYPVYPSGMSAVSGALKNAGHQTFQYDMLFPERPLEQVMKDFNPDITGISVRNIDNEDSLSRDNHWSGDAVKNIVSVVKKVKNIPVFLGGAGFSVIGEEFLNYAGADFGIIGAGEISTVGLVSDILSGNTKNKIYYSKGIANIIPDIDANLLKKYIDAGGLLGVISKRGCSYSCGYCSYPSIDGDFVSFDAKTIVSYIKKLETEYGVKEIFFTDSVFNDSCGFAKALCKEMIKQKTTVRFAAYFNPAGTSFDELKLYKEAGLFAVELGTDASTDTTLKALHKPFGFKEVENFQNMCDELKIPCAHFIIFGGPGETMQTVSEGLENIKKLKNGVVMVFSGIRIHYGTEIYKQALSERKITEETSLLKPHYYFSDKIDISEMNKMIERSFKGDRRRIFPPEKGEEMMKTVRKFGYKGLMWDTLVKYEQ